VKRLKSKNKKGADPMDQHLFIETARRPAPP
jgi:hypothetical protein